MPKHYPAELRRRTCERMLAGEAVKDLEAELGIHNVTLYKWRRQALIDAGHRPGLKSYEADPLATARRRIKESSSRSSRWSRRPAPLRIVLGSMQIEPLNRQKWRTMMELGLAMADYIDDYY